MHTQTHMVIHWHITISHCRFCVQHSSNSKTQLLMFPHTVEKCHTKMHCQQVDIYLIWLHVSQNYCVVLLLFCPLHVSGLTLTCAVWLVSICQRVCVWVCVCVYKLLIGTNKSVLTHPDLLGWRHTPYTQSVPNCLVKTADFGGRNSTVKTAAREKRLPMNVM